MAVFASVAAAKLQAAMQKTMPQPGEQRSGGSPDDMAANLAQELGLSESKVKSALDELMPQPGTTPPNSTSS